MIFVASAAVREQVDARRALQSVLQHLMHLNPSAVHSLEEGLEETLTSTGCLRWVACGLLWAESRWNRIHGYRELPMLVKELEPAVVKHMPFRRSIVT